METKLDPLDLNIIRHLQMNGRISVSELSNRVKSSRPTVTSRLKRLLEDEIILIKSGLNLKKFGFKMAFVGLEVKNDDNRRRFESYLKSCPRVLNFFRTPGKANIQITLWGEDDQTINSTIESFRDLSEIEIVNAQYVGTPIYGDMAIEVSPMTNNEAPCGMKCNDCSRYANNWCVGCPDTTDYKNPISR